MDEKEIASFFSGFKGRLIRGVVSLALSAAIAKWQNNTWYVSLSPALQSFSKWLRDKYPGDWEWLPF